MKEMNADKERCASVAPHKWFGLSLQALVILARKPDICPSAEIASRLHADATLLRRVLVKLAREQLIETREGRDGGYRLKRSPESITLADVYSALKVAEPLCSNMLDTACSHEFGSEMKAAFTEIANEVERKTLEALQPYTIADLADRTLSTSK
ncbi:Rrf2 family transcriptional regulator [Paenibacillus harenae]|uniref:Rrf2 family protein n=1 Tax=Paenibacillus harenae TaxID=306543 RepID=A0ABT9U8D2_PAEHA|nr:Rrf2 family transcriptional regulator [Paenibacillus harenae]MDQ0060634.1 Rrf2 family protein [Paenibacillus harenae]MDQ0115253.1 Rrf2 family protein [Paenibacillus harenae]